MVSVWLYLIEILHQTTTRRPSFSLLGQLYLIEILHQTTTALVASGDFSVVSYWNSTSNHNSPTTSHFAVLLYLIEILHQTTTVMPPRTMEAPLYLIEILHQTTTSVESSLVALPLYLIEILHQTTTRQPLFLALPGCILLKFYIKPQPVLKMASSRRVVSYWNSTSNHNFRQQQFSR